MTKIYTWSIFTRLFHILLVIAVGLVYILSEEDTLLEYHVIFGYFIAVLFLYRVIWGFLDVKYSRFNDFNFNIKDLISYIFNIFTNKKEYIGHNPAASWAIVAMIILGLFSVISGMLVYGTQEGMGIFSFLNNSLFKDMELFEEIHELLANNFMVVVFIHITGVMVDKLIHKTDTLNSILNGCKTIENKDNNSDLKLNLFQKLFGFIWISSSILFLVYLLNSPTNILIADANKAINYKQEHTLFYEECISCHTLYPPYLLPKKSWIVMMDNLENHFGDDASLDETDTLSIKEYLINNSANSSTKESAFKIIKSINEKDENKTILAITETKFWINTHKSIDKDIFKNKTITKNSNCKACHKNFEQGLLNDKDIKIPKG